MAKIYIAGKVSGLPWIETSMKFGKYQLFLMHQGHEVVVPLDICDREDSWSTAMRKCITALMTCDEIHLLHDWADSPGANIERNLSDLLSIKVVYVEENHKS